MALFRVDFQGTLHGIETFQHGHHISSTDSSAGVASDAATAWLALLADADFSAWWPPGVQWSQVNVSELGATPAAPIVTSAQATIGDGGTGSGNGLPPQVAPCISLTTATAGSRARGRMFLPAPDDTSLTSSGRISSGFRAAVMPVLEVYFESWAGNAADVVVVSGVGGVYTTYTVNTIRLGDVFETQRSRRSSIAEVYTTASI